MTSDPAISDGATTGSVSCDDLGLLASEMIDGELSPEAAAALTQHLEECPECRRATDQLHAAVRALRQTNKSQAAADAAQPPEDQAENPQVVSTDALPTTEPSIEPELDTDADNAKMYIPDLYPEAEGLETVMQADPGFPQPEDAFGVQVELNDGTSLALSAEQIDEAVAALPEPSRAAVTMVDMQRSTRTEAAAALGLTRPQLLQALRVGRESVRDRLMG